MLKNARLLWVRLKIRFSYPTLIDGCGISAVGDLVRYADSKPMYKEGKSIALVMRLSVSAIELVLVPEKRPLEFFVTGKVFLHRRVF